MVLNPSPDEAQSSQCFTMSPQWNGTETKSNGLTPNGDDSNPSVRNGSLGLQRTNTVRTLGFLKLRGQSDDLPQDWWFASTAIPLIAATLGPLCNVLSIAALVTPWRVSLPNDGQLPDGTDDNGVGITDPQWEIISNAVSLACGFIGNIFLLLNFTGRVRYILALPLSIIFWIASSVILISITSALHIHAPPIWPGEIYSQGFWHAVLAAIVYFIGAVILMINMLGYFLGHYPQQFDLDDDQRTLILQTMMFFFWLAGGAGVFCKIEGFTFTNALYYTDVSVLTIGFGDLYPTTDAGRGFLFVFELLGIIQLGLVISSISRFVGSISADKVIKSHQKHARESTIGRTVTNEKELRERLGLPPVAPIPDTNTADGESRKRSINNFGRLEIVGRTVTFHEKKAPVAAGGRGGAGRATTHEAKAVSRDAKMKARAQTTNARERRKQRRKKLLLLQEEKDRFDAMREIQEETKRFKQYSTLGMSLLAFLILWMLGAVVFLVTESRILGLSYFESLYFCFVSLLTIGYGDFSPKSNVGKPFFIVWSIIAVPTMTVLIQELSSTVVSAVNNWTFALAEWTVLPRKGLFKTALDKNPYLKEWVLGFAQRKQADERVRRGFYVEDPDEDMMPPRATTEQCRQEALERLAGDYGDAEHDLARQLALAIKSVAGDLRATPPKRYLYEQWVHFTKLIRFSRRTREEVEQIEEEEGLVEWDWIGEDSPMLADVTEAEWVLDRLCESLNRYTKRQAVQHAAQSRRDETPEQADDNDNNDDPGEGKESEDENENENETEGKGEPSSTSLGQEQVVNVTSHQERHAV